MPATCTCPSPTLPLPNPQTLEEAYDEFCNTGVSAKSCSELLASVCESILKKGGREKLSDEEIEDILGKVGAYPGR